MNGKFPKTLAALKEVKREESLNNADETLDHGASDSAYWAVGDALIEECGVDPVWDLDDEYWPYDFKGGSQLHAASEWLMDHGIDDMAACYLLQYRMISELYPPETRSMNVTYCCHIECGGPEEVARMAAMLEPGQVLGTLHEDHNAHALYGPC